MVSAFSFCLLAAGIAAVSSQVAVQSDGDSLETQVSERRTFGKGKPVKFIPLVKKHKKGGFLPHVFGKTSYAEAPVVHEGPIRPLYKFHRYQGIEVKPISDVAVSTPEPIIETHSSYHGDFTPSSSFYHHGHDKPVFSSGASFPEHAYAPGHSFPEATFSSHPAPAFAPIKAVLVPIGPPQVTPVFSPVQFSVPSVSLPRPAPVPVLPPSPAPSAAPVFTSFPAPHPAPVFPSFPIKIQAPAASPAPIFSPVSAAPLPVLPQIAFPSPAPAFPAPTFAPPLGSFSVSTPEPEFPYPPSGTPIPSYIKDISLSDVDIKESPLPTPEPVDVHHPVTEDAPKNFDHVLGAIGHDGGLLQKFKGWKADKASAALSHLSHFRPKPAVQPISIPHNKLPLELPASQTPVYPPLQFAAAVRPLPLAPAPVFLQPGSSFFPGGKHESFAPNAIESPPALFNSYGVPIPHDTYAAPHVSHDRLAPAASEEEPAVLPAPADQKQERPPTQQVDVPQQQQQFQPQFQAQALVSHESPVYVADQGKAAKEGGKPGQEVLPEREPEATADDVPSGYPNHKE